MFSSATANLLESAILKQFIKSGKTQTEETIGNSIEKRRPATRSSPDVPAREEEADRQVLSRRQPEKRSPATRSSSSRRASQRGGVRPQGPLPTPAREEEACCLQVVSRCQPEKRRTATARSPPDAMSLSAARYRPPPCIPAAGDLGFRRQRGEKRRGEERG